MSVKKITRVSQNVMCAEFTWNFDDTMVDINGRTGDFGIVDITTGYSYDVIKLPPGAMVVGGSLSRTTAFDTAGYTIILGDSGDDDRYIASADLKAVGTTALLVTGFRNPSGLDVRLKITNTDVCTTGVATLRVLYTVDGRANEVTAGPV